MNNMINSALKIELPSGGEYWKKKRKGEKRMIAAVAYLQNYMATYDKQYNYEKYSDETLINDVLYGLGAALSEKYRFAGGFDKFKDVLLRHLDKGK